MAKSPFEIELSEEEFRELRSRAARYTVPHGEVLRAKIVLLAAEGTTNAEIASSRLRTADGVVVAETLLRGAA